MSIVRVALDLPLPRLFDYLAPEASTRDIGYRVSVPFGRNLRIGVIVDWIASSEQPIDKLKPVTAILRDMPPLPTDWLTLCEFCARYYQAPLGEVMAFALPPMLRRGKIPRLKKIKLGATSPPQESESAPTLLLPSLLAAQART